MDVRRQAAREGWSGRALRQVVASSAEPAYVTGPNRRVLAWNDAAAQFLGHTAAQAIGSRCWELLGGTDVHGNAHCGPRCPVVQAFRLHKPVHDFATSFRAANGSGICARVTAIVVSLPMGTRGVLHVLHPCQCQEPIADKGSRGEVIPTTGAEGGMAPSRPGAFPSARELAVLRLLALGASTNSIASSLFISPHTVRNHVKNILAKLEAHSRLAAVRVAEREGIL